MIVALFFLMAVSGSFLLVLSVFVMDHCLGENLFNIGGCLLVLALIFSASMGFIKALCTEYEVKEYEVENVYRTESVVVAIYGRTNVVISDSILIYNSEDSDLYVMDLGSSKSLCRRERDGESTEAEE